jgi:hypothetical protein
MKKLSLLGAVLAVMLVPLAFGANSYAAEGTCAIGFTGPDSHNVCTATTTFKCSVENNNALVFDNDNNQVAKTGLASGDSSTSGGNSSSGSATNANGVTFTTTVKNDEAKTCTVVATSAPVTPVVTPPAVVETPQGGGGAAGAGAVQPAALANTATVSPIMVVAGLLGLVGVSVILSRVAVAAYGHIKA